MKALTFSHQSGIYTMAEFQVTTILQQAVRIRHAGVDVFQTLQQGGVEERLLNCIQESAPWLYQNLQALGTPDSTRPFVAVPQDWVVVVDHAWRLLEVPVQDLISRGQALLERAVATGDRTAIPDAEALLRQAVAQDDTAAAAWYYLGCCRDSVGDRTEAMRCQKKSVRLDPTNAKAWNNLGMISLQQDEYDEADKYFNEGLLANPDHPKLYLGRAMVASNKGRQDLAIRYLKAALEKDPDYQKARIALSEVQRGSVLRPSPF